MSERMSEGLGKVYAATGVDELADAYALWSADYDRETLSLGYCLPFLITAFISRHVSPSDGPLLDAGCGTGLSGPCLRALGYREIDGLDMAPGMLAHARARNCYGSLAEGTLGEALPFADETYAAVFSTGVFTEGHAPASSLRELARITRRGGHLLFTVRDSVFEDKGFRQEIDSLLSSNQWVLVEESPPFRAFAIAEPDVLVRAWVLRRATR